MPVSLAQTERWIVSYLRHTSDSERLALLAKIGNLLIADQVVSDADHELLDEYHRLMASIPARLEASPDLLKGIGTAIGKLLQSLTQSRS